jgi:undecaprenyl diphosphate synthase
MNERIPDHVGIIMDGNGRWARSRGLPRTAGHLEGLKVAKRMVAHAIAKEIKFLSLYAFSTENWKRTVDEVGFLMSLVSKHLIGEMAFYQQHGVKLTHSGNIEGLPQNVRQDIERAIEATHSNGSITVNLAINYGGRDEIIRAANDLAARGAALSESSMEDAIRSRGSPSADLIIRTGGEMRLSNFLLWQSAYSELYFSDTLWPDWSEADFDLALESYSGRDRRFGGIRE